MLFKQGIVRLKAEREKLETSIHLPFLDGSLDTNQLNLGQMIVQELIGIRYVMVSRIVN